MWCHIAHLYPVTEHKKVSKYKNHIQDVDYTGIIFLVTIVQIIKIE